MGGEAAAPAEAGAGWAAPPRHTQLWVLRTLTHSRVAHGLTGQVGVARHWGEPPQKCQVTHPRAPHSPDACLGTLGQEPQLMVAVRVTRTITPLGLAWSFKRCFGPCGVQFISSGVWGEGNQRAEGEGRGWALPAGVLAGHQGGISLCRKEKSSAASSHCYQRSATATRDQPPPPNTGNCHQRLATTTKDQPSPPKTNHRHQRPATATKGAGEGCWYLLVPLCGTCPSACADCVPRPGAEKLAPGAAATLPMIEATHSPGS